MSGVCAGLFPLLAQTAANAGARAVARASSSPASTLPLPPVLILALCAIAGVGTVLLLPSRREAPIRNIGGAIVLGTGAIFAAMLVRAAAGSAAGQMNLYFWIFSGVGIVGAVRVITHTRPVYSALYFVLT